MRIGILLIVAGIFAALGGCSTTPVRSGANGPSKSWIDRQHQDLSLVAESSVTTNGIQVYLKGDLLFKVGRSKLSDEGAQKVDAIAVVLVKYSKDQVTVLDYSDNSGKPERNQKLTQRRADSIMKELVKKGVPAESLTAVGKGAADPVAPNDTPDGRAQNRRAELDITMP